MIMWIHSATCTETKKHSLASIIFSPSTKQFKSDCIFNTINVNNSVQSIRAVTENVYSANSWKFSASEKKCTQFKMIAITKKQIAIKFRVLNGRWCRPMP